MIMLRLRFLLGMSNVDEWCEMVAVFPKMLNKMYVYKLRWGAGTFKHLKADLKQIQLWRNRVPKEAPGEKIIEDY